MKERMRSRLEELVSIPGAAGHEQEVLSRLYDLFSKVGDSITADPMGNIYVRREGTAEGPLLLAAAHADQIGAAVKYIDDRGFIRFEKRGGMVDGHLAGRKVSVGGCFGVIGCRSGHYQKQEDKHQLYIDVGAASRQEVEDMGIAIGTPITYISPLEHFENEDLVCSGALDDRLGCAVLLQALEELDEFAGTFIAAITVQEEVGLRGAMSASLHSKPDLMLAVDTIPAGNTPDLASEEVSTAVGEGPVFAVSTKGMIIHPRVKELLIRTAEEEELAHQLMLFNGGDNDSAAPHRLGQGIPTGSISLPRRYSHSPVEVADLNDAVSAVKILNGFIRRMGDWDFSFLG